MSNWTFSVGGGHPALVASGHIPPPTPFSYATHIDLLVALANGFDLPPGQIEDRLWAGASALGWPKLYSRLRTLEHFPKYRSKSYDTYKAAALAKSTGHATPEQLALASGLSREIQLSAVQIPPGQVLFHGRSDTIPSIGPTYPAFLSTTLNPFVARQSAKRRIIQLGGRKVVYALTVQTSQPALWGHVGRSGEWELLLDADLPVLQTGFHRGTEFDIVEADIG